MLGTLKAILDLPTWSVVLTLVFAAMSASSALAGFLVKRHQESMVAQSMEQRSSTARSNADLLEHLFGSTVIAPDGTAWVLKSAEAKRFDRLDLAAWPKLKAERDALLARLQALPAPTPRPDPRVDTPIPRELHDDLIQFRKEVLAAK